MSRKTLQMLIVLVAVIAVSLVGCNNPVGSDGGGGGGSGDGASDGTLTISGQLSGVGTQSTSSAGLTTLNDDPDDWVIVALYWGPDFVPPDIIGDLTTAEEADDGDAEDVDFDFWEAAEVIPIAKNGTFSLEPPKNHRFVLFAVDLSEEIDPVRGLIGVGASGDEDLVWQALNEEFLNGEVDLGEIQPPEDGSLVWLGEADTESLVENGNLAETDRDTVLDLAYFDDGVGMLKNQLSTGYEITPDGLEEREQRFFFVLNTGGSEEQNKDINELKGKWFGPHEHVPDWDEYGYAIYYFGVGDNLSADSTIEFKPPEDVEYDNQEDGGDSQTISADEFTDGNLTELEVAGAYGGAIPEVAKSYTFLDHLAESWIVRIDDDEYGINLDSSISADSSGQIRFPFPVPAIKLSATEDDILDRIDIRWYRVDGDEKTEVDEDILQSVTPSYSVQIDDDADDFDDRFTEEISVSPAATEISLTRSDDLEEDWSFADTPSDDEKALWRITFGVNAAMTGVMPYYGN